MTELYNGLNPGMGFVEGSYTEDLFIEVGEHTPLNAVIAAGQVLVPGSIVAQSTADDKFYEWERGGANGIDVPAGVLTHAIDTSATGLNADDEIQIIHKSTARINENGLSLHASWTGNEAEATRLLTVAGLVPSHQIYSAA